MAENYVVKEPLTDAMIAAGAALTQQLDKAGLPPQAAFWLFIPEAGDWQLIFAYPEVSTLGPLAVYRWIHDAFTRLGVQAAAAPFTAISIREPDTELVQSLKKVARPANGRGPQRVSRTAIDGHYIDDALIYRAA